MLKLEKRGGFWYMTGTLAGQRVRRSTKVPINAKDSRRLAENVRLQTEQSVLNNSFGSGVSILFREAADEYRKWKSMEGKLTKDMDRKISKLTDYWGNRPINNINTRTIQTFVFDEYSGLQANSIRRYLNQFRAILKFQEKLDGNYTAPKFPMPTVADQRDVHLEESEAIAVLKFFQTEEPKYYPHFLILIDTGARLGEMLRLTRDSFKGDVCRIRSTGRGGKTISRDIPMSDDLKTMVRTRFPAKLNIWHDNNTASATLGKALRRACAYCKIDPIRVHDLRHTFAYLTAQAGADLGDLQFLMGHSDVSMTMRYRGFIPSRARASVLTSRSQLGAVRQVSDTA